MRAHPLYVWVLRVFLVVFAPFAVGAAAEDGPEESESTDPEAVFVDRVDETPPTEDDSQWSSRELYNQGLAQARLGRWDAAEGSFLKARDRAGPDADVLYRSAFNMAHVMASRATSLEEETPERALEALRASASWFGEAVRAAPESEVESAKQNLELVQRRISRLADQINGQASLDDRLRRAIDDQRTIRDSVRGLLSDLALAEQGDPAGHATTFGALATEERVLLADVSDVLLLAAEERAELEALGEEISQEQAVRAQQLLLLERYLSLAEQSLNDTRRRLRQQDAEVSHRLADNGLDELKRSLEQLLDPVAVLKLVLAAEERLLVETAVATTDETPAWLTGALLASNQERAIVRTVDIKERFSYALENSPSSGDEAMAIAPVERAVLFLEESIEAMRDARENLLVDAWDDAGISETRAIAALRDALEQFADIKTLIELTYATHVEVDAALADEAVAVPGATKNQTRLDRLRTMLEAELSAATSAEDDAAREAEGERAQLALELTRDTRQSLDAMLEALRADANAQDHSSAAAATLADLRRLYFTIVEHLQELAAEQSETWDETAEVQAEAIAEGVLDESSGLPRIADRQTVHRDRADELQTALAEMAEQAASQEQGPPTNEDGENAFALASEDMRLASGSMTSATDILGRDAAKLAPVDLEPATENQREAIDHILQAIARLQPPQDGEGEPNEGDSGDDADENDAQMTRRQALQRLQAIRDREAERRRQRGSARPEAVEKDW